MFNVRRALVSVSDKRGLVPFVQGLAELGVEVLSTGGTCRQLREAGLEVIEVSEKTGFPEIMDGRVKTLHPVIHGGLLGRRGTDEAVMEEARHRAHRPRGRQPVPVRTDHRPRRRDYRRCHREHRYRWTGDDSGSQQESRRRCGLRQPGRLRRGARQAQGRRTGDRRPAAPGRESVCTYGQLRHRDYEIPVGIAG